MTSAHPRPPERPSLSASKHLLHRSRRVRLASAREVTFRGERLRYLPQRLPLAVQLAHQCDRPSSGTRGCELRNLQWLVPTRRPCVFPRYFARVSTELANYQSFPL